MKVLNSSKTKKNIGALSLSFPPGISEQPDIPQVKRYVSMNSDLSIYKEELKTEPKPEPKPEPKKKKKKKKEEWGRTEKVKPTEESSNKEK